MGKKSKRARQDKQKKQVLLHEETLSEPVEGDPELPTSEPELALAQDGTSEMPISEEVTQDEVSSVDSLELAETELTDTEAGDTEAGDTTAAAFESEDTASTEEEQIVDDNLPPTTLTQQLTALLFVAPRPLPSAVLAEYTNHDVEAVEACLQEVTELLSKAELGFELVEVAGAYQLRTVPRLRKVIENLIPPRARKLSRAAAETLAVVAYKQPVQRAEIEAIRGVDALPTVRTLLDAKLIRVVGREDAPGQPALYGTTAVFLEKFGLRDLSELPPIREIVEISREPGEVGSREEDELAGSMDEELSESSFDGENLASPDETEVTSADSRDEIYPESSLN